MKKRIVRSFEVGKNGLKKIDYNPVEKCFVFHYDKEVVKVYSNSKDMLRFN